MDENLEKKVLEFATDKGLKIRQNEEMSNYKYQNREYELVLSNEDKSLNFQAGIIQHDEYTTVAVTLNSSRLNLEDVHTLSENQKGSERCYGCGTVDDISANNFVIKQTLDKSNKNVHGFCYSKLHNPLGEPIYIKDISKIGLANQSPIDILRSTFELYQSILAMQEKSREEFYS